MKVRPLFRHDGSLNWAHLKANATVDAHRKINPIPIGALSVFARAVMNARHRAGIHAISDTFTGVGHNRMGHSALSQLSTGSLKAD